MRPQHLRSNINVAPFKALQNPFNRQRKTSRVSPKTFSSLARAIATLSHSEISLLALQFGVENEVVGGNKQERAYKMTRAVRDTFGDASIRDVAEARLGMYHTGEPTDPSGLQLVNALQMEGYQWTGAKLIPTTPGHVALGPLVSALEVKLQGKNLGIAATHYSQALDNFVDGNFESSGSRMSAPARKMTLPAPVASRVLCP